MKPGIKYEQWDSEMHCLVRRKATQTKSDYKWGEPTPPWTFCEVVSFTFIPLCCWVLAIILGGPFGVMAMAVLSCLLACSISGREESIDSKRLEFYEGFLFVALVVSAVGIAATILYVAGFAIFLAATKLVMSF